MRDKWFKLPSGRDIIFEQFHAEASGLGFMMGSPERVRSELLKDLPQRVQRHYGTTGLLVREPPVGPLPAYTFFLQLHSYKPVRPGANCSSLVVVWFADELPESLPNYIASQVEGIDWDKYAKDGYY